MHRSIRPFALAIALLAGAAALPAQQAGMSHDHHQAGKPVLDAELAEHFKGITLTEAQIRQVTEIKARHHKAIEELRAGAGGKETPELAAQVQKHMDAEHAEFLALLDAEQKKRFAENMKAHHAPAAGRPAMDHGAHGGHEMGKAPSKAPAKAPESRRP